MNSESAMQALKIQLLLGLVAIGISAIYSGGVSAAYGFFVGVVNLFLLRLTFNKANKKSAEDPQVGILILYVSAVVRFILLAVLFILGFVLLKLDPLFVVLTFIVMQIGQVFNLRGKQRLTD